MRRLFVVFGLVTLAILLSNLTMMSQQGYTDTRFTQEQLNAWQAIAETYYEPGVDANALLGNEYNKIADMKPGMIVPDFTLLDYEGNAHSLSDYVGKAFILFASGSWY